jgi:hypothetical protein
MRRSLCAACMIFTLSFFSLNAQSQVLDTTKVAQGIVKEVKLNSIKILCAADNSVFVATIDSNTVYDNVQKLTDLKAGDEIQVNYKINHDKNIAITVTKMEVEGG